MRGFFVKMKGTAPTPARPKIQHVFWSWLGAFVGIGGVGILSRLSGMELIIAPFGASCVLIFGVPDSPMAQPRNVIGGHVLASVVSLVFLTVFGQGLAVMALSVATVIALMQLTRTKHPPAGADPLVILMTGAHWKFLFSPILTGSVMLVLIALFFNNMVKGRRYPRYWW